MTRLARHASTRIRAVILDWAGTTVDYGCFAPTMVFIEGFAVRGVTITMDEARLPMGKYKRDHIAEILAMPRVSAAWEDVWGAAPTDADVDALFADFIPRQLAVIGVYSTLIPGTLETQAWLRERGISIGTTTGYTRAMMELIVPAAGAQGYTPDALVTPDDVPEGRPSPYMCWRNAEQLRVYPTAAMVKVGDTIADIDEGRSAGMWTVALAESGNMLGMSYDAVAQMRAAEPAAFSDRLSGIHTQLREAGAHEVIDTIVQLPDAIASIETRMARGEQP